MNEKARAALPTRGDDGADDDGASDDRDDDDDDDDHATTTPTTPLARAAPETTSRPTLERACPQHGNNTHMPRAFMAPVSSRSCASRKCTMALYTRRLSSSMKLNMSCVSHCVIEEVTCAPSENEYSNTTHARAGAS
jgi:hypothetical protein